MEIADSVALALPDHSFARGALGFLRSRTTIGPHLDTTETARFIDEYSDWPPSEVVGVLALAQHFGIRTRLLDWSRRANVAAYFAAADAARAEVKAGFLAVWAIRLEMAARAFPPEPPNRFPRIEVVMPALAGNLNMAAQLGFFTLDRSKTAPQGLELTIANRAQRLKPEFRYLAEPVFWKFLLPRAEAPHFLKHVGLEGVHAATIYPGFSGVSMHLTERRLWPH